MQMEVCLVCKISWGAMAAKTQCCPSPHNQSAEIFEVPPAHPRIVAAGGRSWTVGGRSWSVYALSRPISTSFPLLSCTPVSSLLWLGNHNRICPLFLLPFHCFALRGVLAGFVYFPKGNEGRGGRGGEMD